MTFAHLLRSPVATTLLVATLAFVASLPMLAGGHDASDFTLALSALIAFVVVPLLVVTYLYKESPRAYGFQLPARPLQALLLTVLVFIPHVLVVVWLSGRAEFRDYYGLVGTGMSVVLILLSLLYYAAEEFLFRGFFFFSLLRHGRVLAYGANAAVFALFHIGKPSIEILFAAISALLLCWLSEKTQSFIPAAVVHAAIALSLNLLIYLS